MEIVIVRPGDSLWSIASRYGTSAEELARINQLNDRSRLVPKMALLVPSAETGSRPGLEVNGYAYPNIAQSVLNETLPYLSYLCPFSYHMTTAGELIPIPDSTMVDAARANSAAPLLTITNLGESGGFSGDEREVDVSISFGEKMKWTGLTNLQLTASGELPSGKTLTVRVTPTDPAEQAFAYSHLLPAHSFTFGVAEAPTREKFKHAGPHLTPVKTQHSGGKSCISCHDKQKAKSHNKGKACNECHQDKE